MSANICKDLNITIHFFEDLYDKGMVSYYHVNYIPDNSDFYIVDAFGQGGIMREYAFKTGQFKTLGDICDSIKILLDNAKLEGVRIRILKDAHRSDEGRELRTKQSGLIFFNGKFISKNRQLNEQEFDHLFRALCDHVSSMKD